ncbi:hypothetical protein LOZ12_005080 [Ophidiomyces ophidiicola]|uniref:Uncharacterized protein n=1 Tax=Ophidiomyces ophidiicola TaxID=1387563 RepID=A0ACB8UPG9_9EURO|nr:hypothetical protein LOZ64_005422 [Ophidiomyces ophidiicola]KAI1916438.1 hypothetical protein LOZ61_001095 [Ophidiomyces ophidiicola]KAI1928832.1 hypothetical protein LOZ60_002124 [Ophidiomyces ophidiicola]KAI1938215.1 hypothetical protein LOZ62_005335 [Ophidiomyces ophidiicola]KAI1960126.1 hypothetical protein LOZ59_002782 [Ophidiomyces ophidiicola]
MRQRTKGKFASAKLADDEQEQAAALKATIERYDEESNKITVIDVFRLLFLLLLASSGLSYFITGDSVTWGVKPQFARWSAILSRLRGPVLLTPSELSLYNGTSPDLPIYVSINRTIYDVSASPHAYGPGGSYSFFAGRDATRAFVTGCFEEDLTPDMSGVEEMFIPIEDDDDSEVEKALSKAAKKIRRERELREARQMVYKQVKHWVDFYGKSDKYFYVGRLVPEQNGENPDIKQEKRQLCEKAKQDRPRRSKLRAEKEQQSKGVDQD